MMVTWDGRGLLSRRMQAHRQPSGRWALLQPVYDCKPRQAGAPGCASTTPVAPAEAASRTASSPSLPMSALTGARACSASTSACRRPRSARAASSSMHAPSSRRCAPSAASRALMASCATSWACPGRPSTRQALRHCEYAQQGGCGTGSSLCSRRTPQPPELLESRWPHPAVRVRAPKRPPAVTAPPVCFLP